VFYYILKFIKFVCRSLHITSVDCFVHKNISLGILQWWSYRVTVSARECFETHFSMSWSRLGIEGRLSRLGLEGPLSRSLAGLIFNVISNFAYSRGASATESYQLYWVTNNRGFGCATKAYCAHNL